MNEPSISVVIPTYNRKELLKRALNSVISQILQPSEIIVVDDGSQDGTKELVKRKYPFVKLIRQENQGVSNARNRGNLTSKGNWIALLDSDDEWTRCKLFEQCRFVESSPERLLIHTDEKWIRDGAPLSQRSYHRKTGGRLFMRSLYRCLISPSSAMLNRSLFEKYGLFDENLPACEDYDLWLRICLHEKVNFVPAPLVIKYGGHADQLSKTVTILDRYRIIALTKLLKKNDLEPRQCRAVKSVLEKKINLVIKGAARHKNYELITHLEKLRGTYLP